MGQYNGIKEDLEQCENQSVSLSSQLSQAQSSRASLQNDYDVMSADYDAISQELAALKDIPGPSYFSSGDDLQAWLDNNTISNEPWANTYWGWYAKGVRLQQAAAEDGYVISVQYHYCDDLGAMEYIICIAIIDGEIWAWDPETDDLMAIQAYQLFPDYTPGLLD
jgi:hypothetical protein